MTVARTEAAGGRHLRPGPSPFPRLLLRAVKFQDQLEIVTGGWRRRPTRPGMRSNSMRKWIPEAKGACGIKKAESP
jgi:hypothetical protein